jgi:hypothetical protein
MEESPKIKPPGNGILKAKLDALDAGRVVLLVTEVAVAAAIRGNRNILIDL